MEIIINRRWKKADYTIGELSIGGVVLWNTLEDTDRGLTSTMSTSEIARKKVYGRTAIPTGRYRVLWTVSDTFRSRSWAKAYNGRVPLIDGVNGFTGIRMHPFNRPEESLGCIGVGRNTIKGQITQSQASYFSLLDLYLVPAFKRGEQVWLTIK